MCELSAMPPVPLVALVTIPYGPIARNMYIIGMIHKTIRILTKNHRDGDNWLSGEIVALIGPVSYKVKASDGRIML